MASIYMPIFKLMSNLYSTSKVHKGVFWTTSFLDPHSSANQSIIGHLYLSCMWWGVHVLYRLFSTMMSLPKCHCSMYVRYYDRHWLIRMFNIVTQGAGKVYINSWRWLGLCGVYVNPFIMIKRVALIIIIKTHIRLGSTRLNQGPYCHLCSWMIKKKTIKIILDFIICIVAEFM